MPNEIDYQKRVIAETLAREGKSVREIAEGANIAKETAHRAQKRIANPEISLVIQYLKDEIKRHSKALVAYKKALKSLSNLKWFKWE